MQTEPKAHQNTRKEILEVIRELPGATSNEIMALLPHIPVSSTHSTISNLYKQGIIERGEPKIVMRANNKPYSTATYKLSQNPTPNVVKMRRKEPTEAGLQLQMKQLREEIASLEKWKEGAIARYPELSVSLTVLKARKMVADALRASGDISMAHHVERGDKDDSLPMRVTVRALETYEG